MSQNLDSCFRLGLVDELQERAQRYAHIVAKQTVRQVAAAEAKERVKKSIHSLAQAHIDRVAAKIAAEEEARRKSSLPPTGPSVKAILDAVSEVSGFSLGDIFGHRRAVALSRARQMACGLMRRHRPDLSLPALGRALGGRDHTSCFAACKVFLVKKDEGPIVTWLKHPEIVALGENHGAR